MLIMFAYFFLYTFGSSLKNLGLVYYCNYVLGSYNDGITQMLVSVIGGIPMGIGIFAVWPLAKKFGKRNVTLAGFLLYALGSAVCWAVPGNMAVVLAGQFIKNIGGLPCAYVFMALFADGLDHLEWKSGLRSDGVAMSVYNILAVATIGVSTAFFNALLSRAGYIAPSIIDGETVAAAQPQAVKDMITFSFVGLETFTGVILAVLLVFLSVEKTLPKKQAGIREYRKAQAEAEGKEWIAPEVRAALDEEKYMEENEAAFLAALKEKCEKKGLDYEAEAAAHREKKAVAARKAEKKKRAAAEKEARRAEAAQAKAMRRQEALTPLQRAKKEEKAKRRAEKDEAAWQAELKKGIAYREKITAELKRKG